MQHIRELYVSPGNFHNNRQISGHNGGSGYEDFHVNERKY